jgi:rhodanese-related sulfurtransferase
MNLLTSPLIENLKEKVEQLDLQLKSLERKVIESEKIQRGQILALYNGDKISLCTMSGMAKYCDLTPTQARKKIDDSTSNHIVLDVSDQSFSTPKRPKEAIHIPLAELSNNLDKITSKSTTIIVVSEDGIKSIAACEYLFSQNFLSLKNVSGGYQYLV